MKNESGKGILVFLTERINELDRLQSGLAHRLAHHLPTPENHPEFIEQTLRVQVQLPRCIELRDRIGRAVWARSSIPQEAQSLLEKLERDMAVRREAIRAEPGTLHAALARAGLEMLVTLHQEFSEFRA